jgi:RbsD / FucU transport protein family
MKLMCASILLAATAFAQQKPWRDVLNQRLPYYGHRNWIVIADSAYPLQSAPGIETIVSNESQIETVRHVLAAVTRSPHVRPVVYTDMELKYVSEEDAVGIAAYRQLLSGIFDKLLPDQKIVSIGHEDIINKLDAASKTFNVLIIKTNMVLPYTSVFLELRAGYWGDDAERRLRETIR